MLWESYQYRWMKMIEMLFISGFLGRINARHTLFVVLAYMFVFVTLTSVTSSCQPNKNTHSETHYFTTIPPLQWILSELVKDTGKVTSLIEPGQSPELYDPPPSVYRQISSAEALFFVSGHLDGWAVKLPAHTHVEMFELLPAERRLQAFSSDSEIDHHNHNHGDFDPHFWSDPQAVRSLLPALEKQLCEMKQNDCAKIKENRKQFDALLRALDKTTSARLSSARGMTVFQYHPSFRYFFKRYGIRVVGVIEAFPGREPTPATFQKLIKISREQGVKAVFIEPQLPAQSASVLSESTGLPVYTIDPVGGFGAADYGSFVSRNASQVLEALR